MASMIAPERRPASARDARISERLIRPAGAL
jgi:hypothetical protein